MKPTYNFSRKNMRGVIAPDFDTADVREIFSSLGSLMEHPQHVTLLMDRNQIEKAPVEIGGKSDWWVIKKIPTAGLYKKLIYSLRSSKAARSYRRARELTESGLATPCPIGYVEKRSGKFLCDTYYVAKFVDFDFEARSYFRGEQKDKSIPPENFYQQLGRYARSLHQNGFFHTDFTDGNILVTINADRCDFQLVDLNRVHRRRKIGLIAGIKGITKLNIPRKDRRLFVRSYCAEKFRAHHWLIYRILRGLHITHREAKKPLKKLRVRVKKLFHRQK